MPGLFEQAGPTYRRWYREPKAGYSPDPYGYTLPTGRIIPYGPNQPAINQEGGYQPPVSPSSPYVPFEPSRTAGSTVWDAINNALKSVSGAAWLLPALAAGPAAPAVAGGMLAGRALGGAIGRGAADWVKSHPTQGARVPFGWIEPQPATGGIPATSGIPSRPSGAPLSDRIPYVEPTSTEVWDWLSKELGFTNQAAFSQMWASPDDKEQLLSEYAKWLAIRAKGEVPSSTPTGGVPATGWRSKSPWLLPIYQRRSDLAWVEAFAREHEGIDPITFYGGNFGPEGDKTTARMALEDAEWDKAFDEQFAKQYGRGQTAREWETSYKHRQDLKNQGYRPGGGTWGR